MADHLAVEKLPVCQLCRWELASGVFQAEFGSGDELLLLCAQCAFAKCWSVWHGHMAKKLKSIKLVATLLRRGDIQEMEVVHDPVPLAPTFEWSFYRATFSSLLFDPIQVELGEYATEWAALEAARRISEGLARQLATSENQDFKKLLDQRQAGAHHWQINTAVTRYDPNASANDALPTAEEDV